MSEAFLKILNMSISASWLFPAVLVLRALFRKAPKWVNVLLWGIVAIRLLCPVSVESALSLIPSAETIPLDIGMDTTPAIHSGAAAIDSILNPMLSGSNTPAPGASVNPLQITIAILANVWVLGILGMAVYAGISYWLVHRKVETAVPLREQIFQSENVASPFVLGILRPRIYLPFQMNGQDMAHVIAHEQAHIQRKDHWWKPLGFCLLTVHWFNPLMWASYILLCRDIELACDEKVIRHLDNLQKADYSQALLSCSVSRSTIAACPLAFGEVGVKERVKNVMNYRKPGFWLILTAVVACIAVAVCFLTNPVSEKSEYAVLEARILEIREGHFLVQPIPGSGELNIANLLEVAMKNMHPSPEPIVGDMIRIEYDGLVQEIYPARIANPSSIEVIERMEDELNELENELERLEGERLRQEQTVRMEVNDHPDPMYQGRKVIYELSEEDAAFIMDLFRNHERVYLDSPAECVASLVFQYGDDFLSTSLDVDTMDGRIDGELVLIELTEEEHKFLSEMAWNYFRSENFYEEIPD